MLQLGREILSFTLHFLLQKECQALTTVYTLYSHSHFKANSCCERER